MTVNTDGKHTAVGFLREAERCVTTAEARRDRVNTRIEQLINRATAIQHGKSALPGLTAEKIGQQHAASDMIVNAAKGDNMWYMAQATMYANLASARLLYDILRELRQLRTEMHEQYQEE
jgi:hypothetical protein